MLIKMQFLSLSIYFTIKETILVFVEKQWDVPSASAPLIKIDSAQVGFFISK
jgi:hypothetical protein